MSMRGLETINIAHRYIAIIEATDAICHRHNVMTREYLIEPKADRVTMLLRYKDNEEHFEFYAHHELEQGDRQLIERLEKFVQEFIKDATANT